MAVHVWLKNELTEDEKYHNLMTWLKYEAETHIHEKFYITDKYSLSE